MVLFLMIQMFDSPKRGQGSAAGHSPLLREEGFCVKEPAVQTDQADTSGRGARALRGKAGGDGWQQSDR